MQAEKILRRYADQEFSLTDAASFALMQEQGIKKAFAFDRHFTIAGFEQLPSS
jgi:predicted nucleic acid-binding protein